MSYQDHKNVITR